jgi:hypothetical protein
MVVFIHRGSCDDHHVEGKKQMSLSPASLCSATTNVGIRNKGNNGARRHFPHVASDSNGHGLVRRSTNVSSRTHPALLVAKTVTPPSPCGSVFVYLPLVDLDWPPQQLPWPHDFDDHHGPFANGALPP